MAEDNWHNSEQEKPFPWLEEVVSLLNQSHTDENAVKILLSFFLQSIYHCCHMAAPPTLFTNKNQKLFREAEYCSKYKNSP